METKDVEFMFINAGNIGAEKCTATNCASV